MKFKRGDLVKIAFSSAPNGVPCIVLGSMHAPLPATEQQRSGYTAPYAPSLWYEVYMINRQDTTFIRDGGLSPINPQESESEV